VIGRSHGELGRFTVKRVIRTVL